MSSCGDYLFFMEKYGKMTFIISYIGGIINALLLQKMWQVSTAFIKGIK